MATGDVGDNGGCVRGDVDLGCTVIIGCPSGVNCLGMLAATVCTRFCIVIGVVADVFNTP